MDNAHQTPSSPRPVWPKTMARGIRIAVNTTVIADASMVFPRPDMAPTVIIHRIVLAYLLDFNPALREKAKAHIVCADAAAAAQSGTLDKLVEESFG